MKIIIDTNLLMAIGQFKVDIFRELDRIITEKYELCIIDRTIDELKKIKENQKGKHKTAAKLALAIVKSKQPKIIKSKEDKSVDDLIVDLAKKEKIAVATQDKELKKKLKENKAKIIVLRQKRYLVLD